MRVPLQKYLDSDGTRVYSLVATLPYSPLDLDIGHLARGEWNSLTDRFRMWFLPGEDGGQKPICYLMVRKFDSEDMVVVYMHIVVNIGGKVEGDGARMFTVGVLCNDDVRARAALNSMLGIPPAYHSRSSVRLIEKKWRSDPDAGMRFLANVHSAMASSSPQGGAFVLKVEPPPGMIGELKRGMGTWWEDDDA